MESIITIEQFRQKLFDLINNSNLTIAAGYLVLRDVYKDVEIIYQEAMKKELENQGKEPEDDIEEMEIPIEGILVNCEEE